MDMGVDVGVGVDVDPIKLPITSSNPLSSPEIEVVSDKGNPLSCFPHPRDSCAVFSFQEDPLRFCPKCYCFLCDEPAAKCKIWEKHCKADSKKAEVRREWGGRGVDSPFLFHDD